MLNVLQQLGDRIVSRLIPEVRAEAGIQWTVDCGCVWDSPGYVFKQKECYPQGCTSCYVVRAC